MERMENMYKEYTREMYVKMDEMEIVRLYFRAWMRAVYIPEARANRLRAIREASLSLSAAWLPHVRTLEQFVADHMDGDDGGECQALECLRALKDEWFQRDHEAAETFMDVQREKARRMRVEDSLGAAVIQREFAERQYRDQSEKVADLERVIARKNNVIQRLFARLNAISLDCEETDIEEDRGKRWHLPEGILELEV